MCCQEMGGGEGGGDPFQFLFVSLNGNRLRFVSLVQTLFFYKKGRNCATHILAITPDESQHQSKGGVNPNMKRKMKK